MIMVRRCSPDNAGSERKGKTMEHFDILLWDLDGTLTDFTAAERAAIRSLFHEFGLGACTDDMLARYSAINKKYWEMLERGEMTKSEILTARFAEFFREEGIEGFSEEIPAMAAAAAPLPAEVPLPAGMKESAARPGGLPAAFNEAYQLRLGDTVVYCDNSYELVKSLKGKIPQYIVSNGTVVAQTKKLRTSGFGALMDGVFLSEELGHEKPAREFFDAVFAAVGVGKRIPRERVLIVGDSLTSDIPGGNRAGIKSCWYNPAGIANLTPARPDYEIENLWDLTEIL